MLDKELQAIQDIIDALDKLEDNKEKLRVVEYILSRNKMYCSGCASVPTLYIPNE